MSDLGSSIVRGFGHTVGRTAANALLQPSSIPVMPRGSKIDCYSREGWEEGQIQLRSDMGWIGFQVAWHHWLAYLLFPFFNVAYALVRFYKTFIPKYYTHFYEMQWQDKKVSDARYKSGIREFKVLQPVYSNSVISEPRTRNKVEAIVALVISLATTLPIVYVFYAANS